MTAIALSQVSLALSGRTVLFDVNLAIGDREFIGVFGPNGAGKTTLMRALLGLIPPTRGTIRVLGNPVSRGNPAVGYVPQVRASSSTIRLSGRAVVASVFNSHRLGLPVLSRAGAKEVDWALDMVGGRSLADRPLAEMSGGERQRIFLAQGLIGRPRLLLLDEPLISLDPRYQREVVELARALQQELSITVLFSAHELNPLLGALDRVLYLGGGSAALGTVEDVVTGPVLSRLYGSPIDVVHLNGRIFVLSSEQDVAPQEYRHDVCL
jgi:zinc/manganese transport system ATP-binding protein